MNEALNRAIHNTVNRYFNAFRERTLNICTSESSFDGDAEVKVDESYFSPRRAKGKHSRGAYGKKTIVFGVLDSVDMS